MTRVLLPAARFVFNVFFLLTAAYALLAYVPFTYVQVVQTEVIPGLPLFVTFHSYLFWLAFALAGGTLGDALGRPATRAATLVFLVAGAGSGVWLWFRPLLVGLRNDAASLYWSLGALAPILWVAAIDLAGHWRRVVWSPPDSGDDQRLFRAAVKTACFATLLYAAIFYLRPDRDTPAFAEAAGPAVALLWSLVSHLLLFAAVFVAINLVRGLAGLFARPAPVEFVLSGIMAAGALAAVIHTIVLTGMSLERDVSVLVAVATGASLVVVLAGLAVRLYEPEQGPVASGVELLLSPFMIRRRASAGVAMASLTAIAGLAYVLAVATARIDWNYLLQQVGVLLVWVLAFSALYAATPRPRPARNAMPILLAGAIVVLGVYATLEAGSRRSRAWLGVSVGQVLERYAAHDVSYKLIRERLAAPRASGDDLAFFEFLQEHTNLSRDRQVAPIDVSFVERLAPSAAPKPNVFLFVVDSLRQDYLSPYRPAVAFTPEIDRFARASVVFSNAFTRYGATGLAEPAVWVGGLLPHKQYITPFYPMNALQKLLEAEGYQSLISIDTILRTVVRPSPSIVELDAGIQTKDLDLCQTLTEVRGRLDSALDRPVFVFTQPQNLHVSTIAREGRSVPAGEAYPGFYEPYAARLRRIDACFGDFVQFLKDRDLYEQSVIVVTSDHGDSLGEEGRWGHAYTIFPEILKIPLIVHLPADLRSRAVVDPQALAFSTDITPTLYYLLGHRPMARGSMFGSPLFADRRDALPARGENELHLVASSYGPVYGLLGENGRTLYIADAVNYTDYLYDLVDGAAGRRRAVSEPIRRMYRGAIEAELRSLHRTYRVPERPGR